MINNRKEDIVEEEGSVERTAVMEEVVEERGQQQETKEKESKSYSENAIICEMSNFQCTLVAAGMRDNIHKLENVAVCEEDNYYRVWRPKKQLHLAELIVSSKELQERRRKSIRDSTAKRPPLDRSLSTRDLFVWQQQLLDRIQATQVVLKESTEEILGSPGSTEKQLHMSFKEASQYVIPDQRKRSKDQSSLSDTVTQYLVKKESERGTCVVTSQDSHTPISARFPSWCSKPRVCKQLSTQSVVGAIPIDDLVEEGH